MKLVDRAFSFVETLPQSDRAVFKFFLILTLVTILYAIAHVSYVISHEIPERGGSLREGVVGTPRFVNPLLAVTPPDKDLVALIYSGLLRRDEHGELVPDIAAQPVTISDDGLTYNIVLRQDVTFHDGVSLTADDILFTIARIQDSGLKSPLRGAWDGVTVERIGDYEINFVLSQPYAPFIDNLTLGILPKHIWEHLTMEELPFSQYNSEPIGSGPYRIDVVTRNGSGIPSSYDLAPHKSYYGTTPHIAHIILTFFPNEDELTTAMLAGEIESAASLSPHAIDTVLSSPDLDGTFELYRSPLPRTFALFFNQNENPAFRDVSVRRALSLTLDREALVREVLSGYGYPIDGPIPPGFGIDDSLEKSTSTLSRLDEAREILRSGGWKVNEETGVWEKPDGSATQELRFSIATQNTPALEATAEYLRNTWSELGIPVDIKKFEQSDLTQTVIRPRKYEALLFGTALGRELDLYAFWHSSQRTDPGLNIALYANITTDSLLAELRSEKSKEVRKATYAQFAQEMRADLPALFLYTPEFTYLAPKAVHTAPLTGLSSPPDRFSTISLWYRDTERVWSFLTK